MRSCDVVERGDVEGGGDQRLRNSIANGPQNVY